MPPSPPAGAETGERQSCFAIVQMQVNQISDIFKPVSEGAELQTPTPKHQISFSLTCSPEILKCSGREDVLKSAALVCLEWNRQTLGA